jgi:hypothetical protein
MNKSVCPFGGRQNEGKPVFGGKKEMKEDRK